MPTKEMALSLTDLVVGAKDRNIFSWVDLIPTLTTHWDSVLGYPKRVFVFVTYWQIGCTCDTQLNLEGDTISVKSFGLTTDKQCNNPLATMYNSMRNPGSMSAKALKTMGLSVQDIYESFVGGKRGRLQRHEFSIFWQSLTLKENNREVNRICRSILQSIMKQIDGNHQTSIFY